MKNSLIFLFSCLSLLLPLSAQEVVYEVDTSAIFINCECPPSYPGGHEAFFAYIDSVLVYPETIQGHTFNQNVQLEFAVNTDSTISEIKALNAVLLPFEEEAIRALKSAGNWIPGTWCCGEKKAIKMFYTVQVRFRPKE